MKITSSRRTGYALQAMIYLASADRVRTRGGPCHWEDVCPMHGVWSGAPQALTNRLATGSLATVAAADRAERRFVVPDDAHRRRARVKA